MDQFSQECVPKLKILSTPIRLSILNYLLTGPKCVTEIVNLVGIEQSLLSHHLKVLKQNGLVHGQKKGRQHFYQLTPKVHEDKNGLDIDLDCCVLKMRP